MNELTHDDCQNGDGDCFDWVYMQKYLKKQTHEKHSQNDITSRLEIGRVDRGILRPGLLQKEPDAEGVFKLQNHNFK